jgi:hypothetical protein
MAINLGFEILNNALSNLLVFNTPWIMAMVVTFLSLLIITRDPAVWRKLAFPMMLGWHVVGLTPNYLLYLIAGIIFIIDLFSLQGLSNILTVSGKSINKTLLADIRRARKKKGEQ